MGACPPSTKIERMFTKVIILCLLYFSRVSTTNIGFANSTLNRLHQHLFKDHNPEIRPVHNASKAVQVRVTFGLQGIRKIDETAEKMTTSLYLSLSWVDEFLKWNKSDFDDVNVLSVPAVRLWIPDLYISNSMSKKIFLTTPESYRLTVKYTGEVVFYVGGSVETHCKLNTAQFPFDSQVCSIHVAQWSNTVSQLKLTPRKEPDVCMFESVGVWRLLDLKVRDDLICRNQHQRIQFELHLKRIPTFYVMSIILPVGLLSILNPVVFLVPVDSGEKVSLSITILLAYSVMLESLTNELPEVSDGVSVMEIFLGATMCLQVVSVISSVWIVSIYYRSGPVPTSTWYFWLLRMFKRKSDDEYITDRMQTWQKISRVVDRIMFIAMTAFIVVISVICIMLMWM